jgi:hypothetical protein
MDRIKIVIGGDSVKPLTSRNRPWTTGSLFPCIRASCPNHACGLFFLFRFIEPLSRKREINKMQNYKKNRKKTTIFLSEYKYDETREKE